MENGNTYYYSQTTNQRVTGIQSIDNKLYYFDANGVKRDATFGIDVSKYQSNINWEQVKTAGVKFVIIRIGYRGYGSGALVLDPMFEEHFTNVKNAGLKVGVYFFSQATTEEEAKDEVLVRANGIPTYFAADIAYHYNKLATRGFAKAIDVWGADHHGHVARMKGAMDAIGLNGNDLDVVLMQMVNLMRDGQPVRMSKRTGNAITLTDLLEEVPIDSARFLFNMHDAGSGIDFDLDQAVKTDNDNPVYYVQYAHARICSILKKMESEGVSFAGAEQVDATLLTEPSEMDLIRMLAAFPQEIVMAAEKYDPSRINRFVIDLASAFHRFYGNCRIQGADPAVQQARLALCIGVKNAIFNVLTMFKINVPEKM